MVKTKDILVRKNQKYEVVIADDNIFVVCPIIYDVEEQSEIVKYDIAEIYANQENINTLEDLKFKVFENATCKDCVCFDACASFWYSDYYATNSIEETKKKKENQEVCSVFINKADVVPVVRCSQCRKRYTTECASWFSKLYDKQYFCGAMYNDDFYCSYGERKD